MKLITAVLQPSTLESIKNALHKLDIQGITVSEANGYGRQRGHVEIYRGVEHEVQLIAKVRIEILTSDDKVEDIIDCILQVAKTGQVGDGKIWVVNVEDVVRVRTAERGESAL